jgi:hypothetical protein
MMRSAAPHYYQIQVAGQLDGRWSEWFDGMTITNAGCGETTLAGFVVDQPALHGLLIKMLIKIRDLGLPLIAVICIY